MYVKEDAEGKLCIDPLTIPQPQPSMDLPKPEHPPIPPKPTQPHEPPHQHIPQDNRPQQGQKKKRENQTLHQQLQVITKFPRNPSNQPYSRQSTQEIQTNRTPNCKKPKIQHKTPPTSQMFPTKTKTNKNITSLSPTETIQSKNLMPSLIPPKFRTAKLTKHKSTSIYMPKHHSKILLPTTHQLTIRQLFQTFYCYLDSPSIEQFLSSHAFCWEGVFLPPEGPCPPSLVVKPLHQQPRMAQRLLGQTNISHTHKHKRSFLRHLLLRCGDIHPNPGPLSIATLNIRGDIVMDRWNDLVGYLDSKRLEIVCLTECRTSNQLNTPEAIAAENGYQWWSNCERKTSGVGI